MRSFEVIGRQLTHNGRDLAVGDSLEIGAEDAKLLVSRGRIRAARKTKADTGSERPAE